MSEQGQINPGGEGPKEKLANILRLMDFEAKIETFDQGDGEVLFHVESAEAGRLIGRAAQVLDALQTVLNRMIPRVDGVAPVRYTVDVERYRERRKDKLLEMALEGADRALRTGQPASLPPMHSNERRIVHQALKDRSDVRTHSEEAGEEGQKRVIIAPAGEEAGPTPDETEPGDPLNA